MEWNQLLKEKRLAPEKYHDSTIWKRDNISISEFEKDYKKVISNSSFRRLQDKTQIFPLDKSDFVRTRLTHSIEVSMISKQLGTMVCTYILNEKNKKNSIPLKDLFPFENNTVQHISEVLLCVGSIFSAH